MPSASTVCGGVTGTGRGVPSPGREPRVGLRSSLRTSEQQALCPAQAELLAENAAKQRCCSFLKLKHNPLCFKNNLAVKNPQVISHRRDIQSGLEETNGAHIGRKKGGARTYVCVRVSCGGLPHEVPAVMSWATIISQASECRVREERKPPSPAATFTTLFICLL